MYFSKFPKIEYTDIGSSGKNNRKFAVDILHRITLDSKVKDDLSFFESYEIQDNETPESVSLKIYGSVDYYWVVLLFNDIINPYYDWPLRDQALENYIERKYPGKVLYVSGASIGSSTISPTGLWSGITFAPDETVFRWEGTIDANGTVIDYSQKGLVWRTDRQKSSIEIVNQIGPIDFSNDDVIVKVHPDGNQEYAYIEKIIENKHGVHHFENVDTATGDITWLNPLDSIDGIPIGFTGAGPVDGFASIGGTGSGSNTSIPVTFAETMIGRYMGVGANLPNSASSVANDIHEINENDRKRNIHLMHPKYLNRIVDEFSKHMKNQNTRTIYDPQRVTIPDTETGA